MNDNLLTVCLITYNHEKFIRKSLLSVLNQRTKFNFNIVIADDFSIDNTRDILNKFKEKYSDKIHLIYQKKNFGAEKNWFDLMSYPKSKYIAYLEGDDYWIDEFKLQKQVDFLEKITKYSICFTDSYELIENKLMTSKFSKFIKEEDGYKASLFNFLNPYFYYSGTQVFRNVLDFRDLEKFKYVKDIFFYSVILIHGDLHIINQKCSVYRIHSNGIWSMNSKVSNLIGNIRTFGEMSKYHEYRVSLINESYLWGLIELYYMKESSFEMKFFCFYKFLLYCFRNPNYFKLFYKDFLRL